ncbi:MAG: hypothetical protein KDK64_07030 [Chlamydiia bacterium]|nr:hypothetical protein [Chlamydiia bacterium]
MSDPLPQQPTFEMIDSIDTWKQDYQNLLDSIMALAKGGKAGLAINEIIYKLMPYVQSYNMDYQQGNIANGQQAASYALAMTNYISNEYQQAGSDPSTATADATNAINAMTTFENFLSNTQAWSQQHGIGDPFGSMGQSVESQLESVTDNTTDPSTLSTFWTDSWDMSSYNSGGISGDSGTNSIIMQDVNGAQNQAQSEAAYLQSEAKISNENYQQYSATSHDIAQNDVDVEKAATTAAQSAGN